MPVQVLKFAPVPTRMSGFRLKQQLDFLNREEFLTGDGARMCLIQLYLERGGITAIAYGPDTFFSLWVGHNSRWQGFQEAHHAQEGWTDGPGRGHLDRPNDTEELFGRLAKELP